MPMHAVETMQEQIEETWSRRKFQICDGLASHSRLNVDERHAPVSIAPRSVTGINGIRFGRVISPPNIALKQNSPGWLSKLHNPTIDSQLQRY